MPITQLDFRAKAVKPPPKNAPALFKSTGLVRVYFPGRGLPHSLGIHVIAFTIVYFFASFPVALPKLPVPPEKIVMIDLNDPMSVMFLPVFDGGRPGAGKTERRAKSEQTKPAEPPATTTQGFSYPGPQPIISDVEDPTNRFQTLLQPGLENPPILPPPLALPNIVQIAEATMNPQMEEPPPPPEPEEPPNPEPKPEIAPKPEPKLPASVPKPVDPPKPEPKPVVTQKPEPKLPEPLPKPVESPKPAPLPVEHPKPEPKSEPAPKTVEPPKPEPKQEISPKPQPPAPKPVEPPKPAPAAIAKPEPKVPKPEPKPLEAQTTRTAATEAKTAPDAAPKNTEATASAGQKTSEPSRESSEPPTTTTISMDILSLSPMPTAPGQAVQIPQGEARGQFVISPEPSLSGSDAEPGFKAGTPSPKIGMGNTTGAPARKGVAPKTAPDASAKKGLATGLSNGKPASDAAAAGNSVRGAGAGTASGSGSGSSPAKKPFAGITIVGGEYEPGSDADMPPVTQAVKPLQTAYGLNIISTEDSGGGLPFFGVFSHEQIYTVYLDMRTVETDQDPSWTLEFAVMQDSSSSSAVRNIGRAQQGLVLPFPSVKEKPVWPSGPVRKYLGKMIIVFGVINTEGKMEQLSIKDSPDSLLNEPVIRALGKWMFRPAQSEGMPVPAKALFGIPVWAPE